MRCSDLEKESNTFLDLLVGIEYRLVVEVVDEANR